MIYYYKVYIKCIKYDPSYPVLCRLHFKLKGPAASPETQEILNHSEIKFSVHCAAKRLIYSQSGKQRANSSVNLNHK